MPLLNLPLPAGTVITSVMFFLSGSDVVAFDVLTVVIGPSLAAAGESSLAR